MGEIRGGLACYRRQLRSIRVFGRFSRFANRRFRRYRIGRSGSLLSIASSWRSSRLTGSGPYGRPTNERSIRRATFDLIGLPPTPEEVDAFVNDNSANAFSKVVDRLLASPHYGERWGRYWLDLARYADGQLGASKDEPFPNALSISRLGDSGVQ